MDRLDKWGESLYDLSLFLCLYIMNTRTLYIRSFLSCPNLPRSLQLRNKIIQSHKTRGLAWSISPPAWPISFLSLPQKPQRKNFSARGLVITRELMERKLSCARSSFLFPPRNLQNNLLKRARSSLFPVNGEDFSGSHVIF